MKKFSQLKQIRKIYEQEVTLSKDETNTGQTAVKVEINSDGVTASTDKKVEQPQEQKKESGSVVKFFSKIFEAREMAHVYHLTVKGEEGSHAKHKALGEFYEGIIDLLDEIIEVYQGEFEVIEGYDTIDTSATKNTDAIKYLQELADYIRKERKSCFAEDATHYFNIIDDMLVLIYRTLYKLKYNK